MLKCNIVVSSASSSPPPSLGGAEHEIYAFYISAFECLTGYNIYFHLQDSQESELVASDTPRQDVQHFVQKSRHRLHQKFIKLLNEGVNVSRRVYESLAVSNAVELFKLVFLSTSAAPAVPNLLAEILRRYSQHDLFAAFNYLRENKIMVSSVFLVL
jgi:hypothetical protein